MSQERVSQEREVVASPRRRQRGAEDRRVERMGETKTVFVAAFVRFDDAGALSDLDAAAVEKAIGQPDWDRFTASDLFDDRPTPLVDREQVCLQQLIQPISRSQRTVPAPDVVPPHERTVDMRSLQHLAHEQRCATRDPPDAAIRDRLDLAAERGVQQTREGSSVQRS